jgi:hypothetical protein
MTMKTIEFRIPVSAPGARGRAAKVMVDTRTLNGRVCLLQVGERKHRFVMHDGVLSDWRTGFAVGNFREKQALWYASNPYRTRLSDRDAAQALLTGIVARVGVAKVESVLAAHPTINA